jgi:hypothetical protein
LSYRFQEGQFEDEEFEDEEEDEENAEEQEKENETQQKRDIIKSTPKSRKKKDIVIIALFLLLFNFCIKYAFQCLYSATIESTIIT